MESYKFDAHLLLLLCSIGVGIAGGAGGVDDNCDEVPFGVLSLVILLLLLLGGDGILSG